MNKIILSIGLSSLLASMLVANQTDDAKIAQLEKDVAVLNGMKADLEGNSKSGFQLAGYASFDFTAPDSGGSDFTGVKFSPIFHYQYGSLFQFEGELEITTDNAGETVIDIEYAAGTLFINDYMGLQVGKFMSPLGQFVQNVHPSWINKLPTAPAGFGHDGAAPTSMIGAALRGGLPKVANLRSNYVLYVANAPEYTAHGVQAEGRTTSNDAAKTIGGRFALNPIGGMEVGISGAIGEVSETLVAGTSYIARDYDVFGADFMYNVSNFDLKAEYIQQTVGKNSASTLGDGFEGGTWRAVYAQVAYQTNFLSLEPVIRYSDYKNPDGTQGQASVGLNYLFTNNIIIKASYDFNDREDEAGVSSTDSAFNAQLAFGF